MPPSAAYRAATCHQDLGPDFYDIVQPARFPDHILRYRNQRWAERVGLGALTDEEWIDHFGRFAPLPEKPRAAARAALSRPSVPQLQSRISATAAASCSRSSTTRRTAGCSISPPKAAGRRHGRATPTAA